MSTPIYSTSSRSTGSTGSCDAATGSDRTTTTDLEGATASKTDDSAAMRANDVGTTVSGRATTSGRSRGKATESASSPRGTSIKPRDVASTKTTGAQVVEFSFDSSVYMVSPHPDKGAALALSLQGVSLVIPVATISLARGRIADIAWESPFAARTEQWREALLDRVITESAEAILGAAT
ncbi:hypothetical protein [Natronoglycomyces albus]|uniref:Uncharacterized protein n=1 Tax=Natronoglycomyces albus TaxID=2811108 RepID=A0A895XPA4_9ACTN|nr:hypothetical protein [Natronoglycomyces albus]QSB05582.1 hypothetical protein JQS30_01210 [Natronoglycomyces albus]